MTMTTRKVIRGNHYDSRLGGHSYSMWTEGYDYCIEEADGKKYYYRRRNYDHDVVYAIEPVEIEAPEEIAWEDLKEKVRKLHFEELHPEGTEEEMNLFVYGPQEGSEKNAEIEWAISHNVYCLEITMQLKENLGYFFSQVRFVRKRKSRWTGGYNYVYVIDEKWQVTVCATGNGGYASYFIEDYREIVAQEKAFGRRVRRLSKDIVPWTVGVLVGHIADDKEAIDILKKIRDAREKINSDLAVNLRREDFRRDIAFEILLGETWEKISPCSKYRKEILANYLLGE